MVFNIYHQDLENLNLLLINLLKKSFKTLKGNHQFLNEKVKRDKKHVKLIGTRGNNDICKHLLKSVNCKFQSELFEIQRQKNCWFLRFKDNTDIYTKNLIITAPFPQVKKLVSKFVKTKLLKIKLR